MVERMSTRVLLIDDHALFRRGVAQLIESDPDLEFVGEACDGARGIEAERRQRESRDARQPGCGEKQRGRATERPFGQQAVQDDKARDDTDQADENVDLQKEGGWNSPRHDTSLRYPLMKASRSALIVSACVVGMPWGKPL